MTKRALILVDLQNDFLPGGALAVPDGDQVLPIANRLMDRFDLVVATQDWHPSDHGSFAVNHPGKAVGELGMLDGLPQVMWPVHCVQDTPGAELSPSLDTGRIDRVFPKGTRPRIDSYSGFYDNDQRGSTGLSEWLKEQGVTDVYVMGLATDYCVKFTALDALREGFATWVIEDGSRGVNLRPDDSRNALTEMRTAGARIINAKDVAGGSGPGPGGQ